MKTLKIAAAIVSLLGITFGALGGNYASAIWAAAYLVLLLTYWNK